MPKQNKNTQTPQDTFNKKYGVDFDIEAFAEGMSFHDDFGSSELMNGIYKTTFTELYKKAYGNFIDRKIGTKFDFVEMLNDFENNIMEPYRKSAQSSGRKPPSPYGGWKLSEYIESVDNYLGGISISKEIFAKERYENRSLRMRDMRKYVDGLKKRNDVTPAELSTVNCYIAGLSYTSNNRSLASKIGNLFRYLAEQRTIKAFTRYLEEKTGGPLSLAEGVNPGYAEVVELSGNADIANSRNAVSFAMEKANGNDRARDAETDEKTRIHVAGIVTTDADISNSERINESSVTKGRNVMK